MSNVRCAVHSGGSGVVVSITRPLCDSEYYSTPGIHRVLYPTQCKDVRRITCTLSHFLPVSDLLDLINTHLNRSIRHEY